MPLLNKGGMVMKKKIVASFMAAAMAVGMLAGCGNSSSSSSSASSSSSKESSSSASSSSSSSSSSTSSSSKSSDSSDGVLTKVDLTGQDIYVGIAPGSGGSAWRDQMVNDITGVLDEYVESGDVAGYKVVNNATNGDANEQVQIIRDFIDDPQVNVILINPNDTTALNEAVLDAEAAGKLVVVYDASITAKGVLNVSVDHYNYAYGPTKTLLDIIGGKGTVVEVSGLDGHPANVIRIKATDDAIAEYPDVTLAANQPGGWDNTTSKSVTAAILASGIEPDGIISQDNGCYGVLQACIDANYIPKVVSGDGSKAFFTQWKELVEEGKDFNAVVVPNPPGIGATAARIAVKIAQGKQLDESTLSVEDGVATYEYVVTTVYTNDNFDEGWEVVKDFTDEQCIDEYMTDEEAEALFK